MMQTVLIKNGSPVETVVYMLVACRGRLSQLHFMWFAFCCQLSSFSVGCGTFSTTARGKKNILLLAAPSLFFGKCQERPKQQPTTTPKSTMATRKRAAGTSNSSADDEAGKKTKVNLNPTEDDFKTIAAAIMGQSTLGSEKTFDRRFLEFFGISVAMCVVVWKMLDINPEVYDEDKGAEPKHLLWALLFLKLYNKEGPNCKMVGPNGIAVDPKTFRHWCWLFIEKVAILHTEVVSNSSHPIALFLSIISI